jgi:hypothetical protein
MGLKPKKRGLGPKKKEKKIQKKKKKKRGATEQCAREREKQHWPKREEERVVAVNVGLHCF